MKSHTGAWMPVNVGNYLPDLAWAEHFGVGAKAANDVSV